MVLLPSFMYIIENVGLAGNKSIWDEQIGLSLC
jgi:hypothetical protein